MTIPHPHTAHCRCPGCHCDFTATLLPGLVPRATSPSGESFHWLYCSEECQVTSHPDLARSPKPKPAKITEGERRAALWAVMCPASYLAYDPRKLPPRAKAAEPSITAWRPSSGGRGLALIGHSEAGKSYIAHELCRQLHMEGRDVHLCYLPTLVAGLKGGLGLSFEERAADVARCRSAEVLLLDDVGMETDTLSSLASIYELLDKRERDWLPTVITTNRGREEMEAQFPTPLLNRLRRMMEWRAL